MAEKEKGMSCVVHPFSLWKKIWLCKTLYRNFVYPTLMPSSFKVCIEKIIALHYEK